MGRDNVDRDIVPMIDKRYKVVDLERSDILSLMIREVRPLYTMFHVNLVLYSYTIYY
jgi:hypothetical protein